MHQSEDRDVRNTNNRLFDLGGRIMQEGGKKLDTELFIESNRMRCRIGQKIVHKSTEKQANLIRRPCIDQKTVQ